jgi:hypothetical protein
VSEVEVVLLLAHDVAVDAVQALSEEVEARIAPVWDLVGYDLIHRERRLTLLIDGDDAEKLMVLVLPLVDGFAGPGSHWIGRLANGSEVREFFGPVPEWLRGPLDDVLHDMQQPHAVELRIGWEPPADDDWGLVWITEVGQQGRAGMGVTPMESPEDLKVHIADWMQDQWFPETYGAWGEARPACPGPHPSRRAHHPRRRRGLALPARRARHRARRRVVGLATPGRAGARRPRRAVLLRAPGSPASAP